MALELETKKEFCKICNHEMSLHSSKGCAVMIDDNDSCPCDTEGDH